MNSFRFQSLLISVLFLLPLNSVLALNARIETIDGEVLTIKDFSMEGKRNFYVEHREGTSAIDWKDITSFEVMRIGQNYWVEVLLLNGKKDSFKVRQFFPFRGKTDFGQWSVSFEKMKKAFLIGDTTEEKKKEEFAIKETYIPPYSIPKEVDKITLRNGDILLGNISDEIISIKTNDGTLSFKKENILRLSFGTSGRAQKERELDTLYSKYVDKLTGNIYESQIKITLLTKTNLSIFREHVKEIEFGIMADTEQKVLQEKLTESAPPKSNDEMTS